MTEQQFAGGYPVDDYVNQLRNYRSFVRELMGSHEPDPTHVAELQQTVERLTQPVRATVMSEDWCGDAACTLTAIAALMDAAGIELRIIRGSEDQELKEFYESSGDDHIPAVSLWDGHGEEISRWIEAPASIQVQKSAWKRKHPDFDSLYEKQKSDDTAKRDFAKLYRQLLTDMADWYRSGGWGNVTAEIVSGVIPH